MTMIKLDFGCTFLIHLKEFTVAYSEISARLISVVLFEKKKNITEKSLQYYLIQKNKGFMSEGLGFY